MNILKHNLQKRTSYDRHKSIAERLLQEVWGFSTTQEVPKPKAAACFYYYESLLNNQQLLDDQHTRLWDSDQQSSDVVALISILKARGQNTIEEIHSFLQDNTPNWILDATDSVTIDNILCFAIRLWLFTKPDLNDRTQTLQEAIRVPLLKVNGSSNAWLWLDFSASTLEKRAGFRMRYTSDISEHLTFESSSVIRVFSHACVLERYDISNGVEGKLYPPGLLREVLKTLNLLWPMDIDSVAKRVSRLEEEKCIDIEANIRRDDKFDLRKYQVFGERLAKIQERLEAEEHRRGTARGFKTAIWGIVLTAIFGLVSAATGTIAMWASLKQAGII